MKKIIGAIFASTIAATSAYASLNYDVLPYNGKYMCENGVTASLEGTIKGVRTLKYSVKTARTLGSIGRWSEKVLFEVRYQMTGRLDDVYKAPLLPSADFFLRHQFQESLPTFSSTRLKPIFEVEQYGRTFYLLTPSASPTVVTGRRADGTIVSATLVPNSLTWSNQLRGLQCSLIENRGGKEADICKASDDEKYKYAEKYSTIFASLIGKGGIVSLSPKTGGADGCPLVEIGIKNRSQLFESAQLVNEKLFDLYSTSTNEPIDPSRGLMTKIVVSGNFK
jgi:hypothetical protein